MWEDVRRQASSYSIQLQQIYSSVEQGSRSSQNVSQEFVKRLQKDYPGSLHLGQMGGTWKVNGYTTLSYDSTWQIRVVQQQLGPLTKKYDFSAQTLDIGAGDNRVVLRVDPRQPNISKFTQVTLPSIVASAREVYRTRPVHLTHSDGLVDIADDVYRHDPAVQTRYRMDQFAEALVAEGTARLEMLASARRLYAQGVAGTAERRLPPAPTSGREASSPAGTAGPRKPLWDGLVWYIMAIAGAVVVLKGLARGPRRRRPRNRTWGDEGEGDFDSQEHLNSPAEQAFLRVLEEVVDQERFRINGKTRLADIIKARGGKPSGSWQADFNRISRKHIDFVITDKTTSRIVGVVELDDRSHQLEARRRRDDQVDRMLASAGIPILHYPCRREYGALELERALERTLGVIPREHYMG